jgi:3'(2'), 5'-bisphosphate nucleotidase
MHDLVDQAIKAVIQAGVVILQHYRQDIDVEIKSDGSPLTAADQAAHSIIAEFLADSQIIMVSEESEELHLDVDRYWIVDPLDGTKDFLAGNDEFTINIALIEQNMPVLGVVYVPAIGELYWGAKGIGAWRDRNGELQELQPIARVSATRMAVSRFHDHPDIDVFAEKNSVVERVAVGSALKYGLLAAGEVDVFPRLVGSSEWDTAAGQAVLEAAGGQVLEWHTGQPLQYGKANRRNPRLLSLRSPYSRDEFVLKQYGNELL